LHLPGWALSLAAYGDTMWVFGGAPSKMPILIPAPELELAASYITSVSVDGPEESWDEF
jgi:hypothetical protein